MQRVVKLRLNGMVNGAMVDNTIRTLVLPSWIPTALVVSINSEGGCLTQAKILARVLRNHAALHKVPLLTFAEDKVYGAGLVVLAEGYRSYAGQFSRLGNIGGGLAPRKHHHLEEMTGVKFEYITAGLKKIGFNPSKPITKEQTEYMQEMASLRFEGLKKELLAKRKGLKLEKILAKGVVGAEEAVALGLADQVGSQQEALAGSRVKTLQLEDRSLIAKLANL